MSLPQLPKAYDISWQPSILQVYVLRVSIISIVSFVSDVIVIAIPKVHVRISWQPYIYMAMFYVCLIVLWVL